MSAYEEYLRQVAAEKTAHVLSTEERNNMGEGEFVFPETRRYPIPDLTHGRAALSMVAKHGTPAEQAKVRAAVYAKFPGIDETEKKASAAELAGEFARWAAPAATRGGATGALAAGAAAPRGEKGHAAVRGGLAGAVHGMAWKSVARPSALQYAAGAVVGGAEGRIAHERHNAKVQYEEDKNASFSLKVAGTVHSEDFAEYEKQFADPLVAELLPKCASVLASLKVASYNVGPRPTRADLVKQASAGRTNVIQVSPTRYGYLVKWAAAPDGVQPQQQEVSAPQAQQTLPPEMLQQADEQGAATVTDVEAEPDPLVETPQSAEGFGIYKCVQADTQKEVVGFVIPTLFDPRTGAPTPQRLFVNGSQFAIQPDIQGVLITVSYNLPSGPSEPRGMGVFYKTDGKGIIATIPFNVITSVTGPDGAQYYSATTFDGALCQIMPSDGIKRPIVSPVPGAQATNICMPIDFTWLPLDNEVPLLGMETAAGEPADPMAQQKTASAPTRADIRAWRDGNEGGGCHLSGPVFSKHGSGDYTWDEGVFWLAAAGCPQNLSVGLLEKAASTETTVCMYGLRPLSKDADVPDDVEGQKIASIVQRLVPRPCLLKEAMAIEMCKEAKELVGVDSLDTLLSVGLINKENVQDFVDGLPDLEETQAKLASLVFATQLGLQSVSKTAAIRAMQSLEDVISGLRALKSYQL